MVIDNHVNNIGTKIFDMVYTVEKQDKNFHLKYSVF